jgi:hypothetical protein
MKNHANVPDVNKVTDKNFRLEISKSLVRKLKTKAYHNFNKLTSPILFFAEHQFYPNNFLKLMILLIKKENDKMKDNGLEIDAYRAKEMDKALLLSKLFERNYYAPIKDLLDKLGKREMSDSDAQAEFMKIYAQANIKAETSRLDENYPLWLWNYLKHYDPKLSATW